MDVLPVSSGLATCCRCAATIVWNDETMYQLADALELQIGLDGTNQDAFTLARERRVDSASLYSLL